MKNILKKLFVLLICILFLTIVPTKAATKVVKVGFFSFDGYHMLDENNRSGYGYEYLQEIAKYTNWTYEYVGYDKSWSEIKQMLVDGEIDIITSAQKETTVSINNETVLLKDVAKFSDLSMGNSSTILTTRGNNSDLIDIDYDEYDITVGLLKGNSRNENFRNWALVNKVKYKEKEYNLTEDLKKALENKEIDAMLTSNLRKTNGEAILAQFDSSPFYAVVNDDLLLNELNMAMEKLLDSNYNISDDLYNKYYIASEIMDIYFTLEEREYIKANKDTLYKAFVKIYSKPLSYIEDEKVNGILASIYEKINEATSLNIKIDSDVNLENFKDYDNVIMIDGNNDYNYSEQLNCKQTDNYITVGIAKIMKRTGNNSSKVTVVKNSLIASEYVEKYYQKEDIIYEEDYEECVSLVLNGQAGTFLTDRYNAEFLVNTDKKNKLVMENVDGKTISLALYVKEETDPILLSILNKTISSFSEDDINNIVSDEMAKHKVKKDIVYFFYNNPDAVIAITVISLLAIGLAIGITLVLFFNRRQRLLNLQNARYEEILSGVYVEILELNLDENIKYSIIMNKKRMDRFNVGPAKFTIDSIRNSIFDEDVDFVYSHLCDESLRQIAKDMAIKQFECRVKLINDSIKWYLYIIQGVHNENDKPTVMIYKKDINLEKEEELLQRDALKNALLVAKEAEKIKTKFLSTVSHEMRTPLNAILGYLTLIEETDSNEKTIDYARRGELSATHLLGLINDILDLDDIAQGKFNIVNEPFDFNEFISGITAIFYDQARTKNIQFNVHIADDIYEHLTGDEIRLKQILYNVLSNAVKYTENGKIDFNVTKKIVKLEKLYLRFTIADTGIGMDEDTLACLYESFENRVLTRDKTSGTGLKMPITKTIVNLLKGSINVESKLNVGTTFTIDIPFDTVKEKELTNKNYDSIKGLIVDSDETIGDYVSILLRNVNCKSICCSTMKDAYEKFDETFAFCVVDQQFMNDEVFINELKTKNTNAKLVLMTTYDVLEKSDSFDYYIDKPVFQSSINDMLEKLYHLNDSTISKKGKRDYNSKRVLIVEDNDMNREIAVEILKIVKFDIDTARDGNEGVEKFKENDYDIILMDIRMPNKDGLEATKEIRAMNTEKSRKIVIIGMSANAFVEDMSNAINIGMNDYVAKPIDIDRLFTTLDKYLK